MKKAKSILIVLTVLSVFQSRADVSAVSPDGRNRIVLATDSLACTVERDGKVVVVRSALALETDRGTFAGGAAQVSSRSLCGELKTPVYKKASVSLAANETLADFGGYAVRLVARNDGVAWRFETKGEGEIEIRSERAGVTIPSVAEKALVYRNHLPGREEKIADVMRPDEIATDGKTFVYLPLVYSVGGTTVAVCESDVCDYPIWNLRRNAASGGAGFDGVFPPWPLKVSNNEGVLREDGARRQRNWCVQSEAGYLVRTPATRTYPWRVFLLADSPAKLCECDAVAALARPAADGADFSWVKPGKVAWDWWNAFDNIGDPEGCTTATYERFIDFAASNGVEYVIFDEGWSEKLDIWKFHPNVDVPHLLKYAEARGVGIILWMAWAQVQGEEARVAETFAGLGVKGFKVDFMDRGDAEAERFLWTFADECAKRRLLVDYHGAHRPTGMSRAYPNVVNYEGVHGLEQMKCYDPSRDMMANDVRTFFGRMTAGPLDYTPGAMDNYPLGKYPVMGKGDSPRKFRTFVNPGSLGTRCRQMAMMALYEAPLQMLADSPTKYEKNAESFAFMAKVPTVWDATLGLGGTPETHAAVARKARNGDWYVAAITDGSARRIEIDTSFLGLGDWRIEYFRDAADAAEHPSHYCHGTGCVRAGRLAVELAPGGGYVARLSRSAEADPLDARAAEENRHVVRELGVDGQAEIWNANACQFTYPPQFAFKAVEGAVKYRFVACDAHLVEQGFEADAPTAPLTPVWEKLAENGFVTVTADGISADGKVCGRAGSRRFWKMSRFRPGTYEPPKRGYLEAANRIYDYVFELPSTQYFLETGKPDPDYGLNCYPAKMHGALVSAMVTYAKTRPDRAAAALKLARNAADYLISVSQPAGAPLAYFPPTYDNPKVGPGVGGVGPQGQGKNMLLYGVTAANAYLGLYGETKEANYLEQAKGIVETYLRLQGEDGTCPLKVDEKTGVPVNPNRAFPIDICALLERLHGLTGDARLLAAAERGLAFVRNGPMKNWNWEGQFEDIEPTAKFVNLTKHPPCSTALYLLRHDGKNPDVRAFAREVLRFTEDQFVCWEVPCDRYGFGPRSKPGVDPRTDSAGYWSWRAPSALEQYHCYQPIDSSAAKVIRTYLALWRETHDPLDLAKARALADAIVNEQFENGRVPTFWTECCRRDAKGDWINCMLAAASALVETAETIAGRTVVFDVRDFGAKGDGIAKDTASVQRALDGRDLLAGRRHQRAGRRAPGASRTGDRLHRIEGRRRPGRHAARHGVLELLLPRLRKRHRRRCHGAERPPLPEYGRI